MTRTADGWTVASSGRLGAPAEIIARRVQVQYDAAWNPRSLSVDSTVRGQLFSMQSTIAGTVATTHIVNGTQAGGLQQLTAVDFGSGKPQSRMVYADVRGHLGRTYLSKENYLYIPMYTEANGKAPVLLVVGVNERDANKRLHAEADGSVIVRGIADKGLEGDVKYAFEKNGMSVADTVWVVHAGRAPGDDRMAGTIMMAIGVALAGLFFAVDSYKKRKNAAMRPVQIPS